MHFGILIRHFSDFPARNNYRKRIDKSTKVGVPYATIGLYKTNVGTNADENGNFRLMTDTSNFADTLLISSVGYRPKFVLADAGIIELEQEKGILNEIVITSKLKWAFDTLHRFPRKTNGVLGSNGHQTQVAQLFINPVKNAILAEVNIQRDNRPGKTIFRLRIYNMDSVTRGPSDELCDQVIQVESQRRLITINLESYKIVLPDSNFFIAVEWLKIPYNEFRFKAKLDGKPFEEIRYTPYIGMTSDEPANSRLWLLDYKNMWRPMFQSNARMGVCISAIIKY